MAAHLDGKLDSVRYYYMGLFLYTPKEKANNNFIGAKLIINGIEMFHGCPLLSKQAILMSDNRFDAKMEDPHEFCRYEYTNCTIQPW